LGNFLGREKRGELSQRLSGFQQIHRQHFWHQMMLAFLIKATPQLVAGGGKN